MKDNINFTDKTKTMHIFKDMFVVSDARRMPDFSTVSYQKKTSIEYFLKGSTLTWKKAYRLGCRCRKYDVQFILKQNP